MTKNEMTKTIVAGGAVANTELPSDETREAQRVIAIQNAANITRTLASNRLSFDAWYSDNEIRFFVAKHTAEELRNLLNGFVESEFAFIRNVKASTIITKNTARIVLTW